MVWTQERERRLDLKQETLPNSFPLVNCSKHSRNSLTTSQTSRSKGTTSLNGCTLNVFQCLFCLFLFLSVSPRARTKTMGEQGTIPTTFKVLGSRQRQIR